MPSMRPIFRSLLRLLLALSLSAQNVYPSENLRGRFQQDALTPAAVAGDRYDFSWMRQIHCQFLNGLPHVLQPAGVSLEIWTTVIAVAMLSTGPQDPRWMVNLIGALGSFDPTGEKGPSAADLRREKVVEMELHGAPLVLRYTEYGPEDGIPVIYFPEAPETPNAPERFPLERLHGVKLISVGFPSPAELTTVSYPRNVWRPMFTALLDQTLRENQRAYLLAYSNGASLAILTSEDEELRRRLIGGVGLISPLIPRNFSDLYPRHRIVVWHGTEDAVSPLGDARFIVNRAGESELILRPGAGHDFIDHEFPELVHELIIDADRHYYITRARQSVSRMGSSLRELGVTITRYMAKTGDWGAVRSAMQVVFRKSRPIYRASRLYGWGPLALRRDTTRFYQHLPAVEFTSQERTAIKEEVRYTVDRLGPQIPDTKIQAFLARLRPYSARALLSELRQRPWSVRGREGVTEVLRGFRRWTMPVGNSIFVTRGTDPALTAAAAAEAVGRWLATRAVAFGLSTKDISEQRIANYEKTLFVLALYRRGGWNAPIAGIPEYLGHSFEAAERTALQGGNIARRLNDYATAVGDHAPSAEEWVFLRAGDLFGLGELLARASGQQGNRDLAWAYAYRLLNAATFDPVRRSYPQRVQAAFDAELQSLHGKPFEDDLGKVLEVWTAVEAAAQEMDRQLELFRQTRQARAMQDFHRAGEGLRGSLDFVRETASHIGTRFVNESDRGKVEAMLQLGGGTLTDADRSSLERAAGPFADAWMEGQPAPRRALLVEGVHFLGLDFVSQLVTGQILGRYIVSTARSQPGQSPGTTLVSGLNFLTYGRGMFAPGLEWTANGIKAEPKAVLFGLSPGMGPDLTAAVAAYEWVQYLLSSPPARRHKAIVRNAVSEEVGQAAMVVTLTMQGSEDTLRTASMFGLPLPLFELYYQAYSEARDLLAHGPPEFSARQAALEPRLKRLSPTAEGPLRRRLAGSALAAEIEDAANRLADQNAISEPAGRLRIAHQLLFHYAQGDGDESRAERLGKAITAVEQALHPPSPPVSLAVRLHPLLELSGLLALPSLWRYLISPRQPSLTLLFTAA